MNPAVARMNGASMGAAHDGTSSSAGFVDDASGQSVRGRAEELHQLRAAAQHLGAAGLRDGSWFERLTAAHIKSHTAKMKVGHWDRVYPGLDAEERADKLIAHVAMKAAGAGFVASIGASSGEILSFVSEGLAAPVGLPIALVSMLLETAYTAILHVDLACDLASMFDVPFDVDDTGEMATLFAVAKFGDDEPAAHDADGDTADAVPSMMHQLEELEEGSVAGKVGRKLLEDSVLRNIVPFVGIAVSAPWNYTATKHLGSAVKKYVRYRRAIERAAKHLHFDGDASLLVEGMWLLATVDGAAKHEELLAISVIVDQLPTERKIALNDHLVDDEDEWLARAASVPRRLRPMFMDAFYLLASVDRVLQPAERRFLKRVGKALDMPVDFDRVRLLCKHLSGGDDVEDLFALPDDATG